MPIYKHTQPGTAIRIILAGAVLFALFILLLQPDDPASLTVTASVMVVLGVLIVLFNSITASVSLDEVRVSLGPGLIRKQFRIEEIRTATQVKNQWYYGWGVRLTPHGWLYNVSGFDAVELLLKTGKKFRIGTDDPAGLAEAIQKM